MGEILLMFGVFQGSLKQRLLHIKAATYYARICHGPIHFESRPQDSRNIGTAPTWVPIWGPGSPWGPFSDFGSPLGPHLFFKVPIFSISSFKSAWKSVQPLSNDDHLIIHYKWHKHCELDDESSWHTLTLWIFKKIFISLNLLVSVNFSNIRFLGPHFCCRGSPFGPHFTQNWVPIRSPSKKC